MIFHKKPEERISFADGLAACAAYKKKGLRVPLGRTEDGEFLCIDLAKQFNLLVGGAGGMGKSALLHTVAASLMKRYTPAEVRLLLCDPTASEFGVYAHAPHMLVAEPVTEDGEILAALRYTAAEVERRLALFEEKCRAGEAARSLEEYNPIVPEAEQLPRLVVVLDGLERLMQTAGGQLAEAVASIGKKARAAGVYLLVSTRTSHTERHYQALSAHFSSRIAFRVPAEADSCALVLAAGAEKLRVRGEFLYYGGTSEPPVRVQGIYVTQEERVAVAEEAKITYAARFDDAAERAIRGARC